MDLELTTSKNANINYLAQIVEVEETDFSPHPNVDKLKLVNVHGNILSTSINAVAGIYVFFPVESVIAEDFLRFHNLYRDTTLNKDPESKGGFFEVSGRVKCIKLRGIASEGFLISIQSLIDYYSEKFGKTYAGPVKDLVGINFDTICNTKLIWKYIIKTKGVGVSLNDKPNKRTLSTQIVEDQFRFHIDTPQLVNNLTEISPDDIIQISIKEHGTSAIFCNLLTKRNLSWIEKILSKIGINIQKNQYTKFCSSRRVIKDPTLTSKVSQNYYDVDIWNLGLEIIKDYLEKGMTVYAEIVGYMPTGSSIQKDYDYGCVYSPELYDYKNMTAKAMFSAKLFKIVIYRITLTNTDGKVFEWSTQQVKSWCERHKLETVKEQYYGRAKNLFSTLELNTHWHENFLSALREKYLEGDSVLCANKVPEEGIVLRREVNDISVFKLKANRFLQKETKDLDKGIIDIESSQEN